MWDTTLDVLEPTPVRLFVTVNGVWFVLDSPDRLFVTIDGVERSRPDGSWVTTLLIVPVSDRLFVTVDGVRYCSLDCM